jgi:hypothetical protein
VEKKVKVPLGPNIVDGFEVPITESIERWTELKLEDGSVLRIKPNVLSATRIENMWDPEGNPMYAVKALNSMVVVESKDYLKRPTNPEGKPPKAN